MLVPDRLCVALPSLRLDVLRRLLRFIRLLRPRLACGCGLRGVIVHDRLWVRAIASKMLARDGFAAIWVLHLSAARAYREGRKAAATSLVEIADAAEREWLKRRNTAVHVGNWQP
jgi:hypothetical protein